MILRIEDVRVSFHKERQEKLFGRERQRVLNGVSLEVRQGESVALVGESGSGKSTLGRVLCGLLKPDAGSVTVDGLEVYGRLSGKERAYLRNRIGVVFQDYTTSVNPRFRVGEMIGESLRVLRRTGRADKPREEDVVSLLEQVGLPPGYAARFPHELSGGQLQRVCIARAVALKPDLIVLDEAISSLDASTQTQVMDLLLHLRRLHGFSYFFITHDLTAVTYMCDRVLFFNRGNIVEAVDAICDLPHIRDAYARRLLDSVIRVDAKKAC